MKTWLIFFMVLVACGNVWAHCEIPCGIYDDAMRIKLLREHITTIEKSMQQIIELTQAKERNDNQIVRWVVNKEQHVDKFQQIVFQYFMTQRIKPVTKGEVGYDAYVDKVMVLHSMLVTSMKAKQTTDLEYIQQLRQQVDTFEKLYFEKKHKE